MESRTPSTRTMAIVGAVAVAIAVGVGVYASNPGPAPVKPAPVLTSAPASASVPTPAGKHAPAAAATAAARPAASGEVASESVPSEPPVVRNKEQAAAALMALPELQAWSALLEKNSAGKTHGALIEYDPAPRKLNGKSYWQFSFVENSAESAQRWESFLVSSNDDEILVEDASTDEVISLARWRREKHPSRRTSIDG